MIATTIFDRAFRHLIRHGRLEVTFPGGKQATYGEASPDFPDVAIRLTEPGVITRILRDRSLGTAEAFMDGSLLIERGDVMELAQLVRGNAPFEAKRAKTGRLQTLRRKLMTPLREANEAARSKANVSHHYDIGNALYRMMLDVDHMQYSCAYWPREGMTLEQAQEAKLAHIAAKLALEPGQRVLDIGCGWGGMAIYLARHTDVHVTGITLSEEQLSLARQRAVEAGVAQRVEFELVDYRALPARGLRYDRIVSVGMFEHVGRPQFYTFFDCAARLLTDKGVMLLHTIGRMGGPGATDAFTHKYIFPGGYIPALSEIVSASEPARLIATDVETLRLHYALTLREWYKRCLARRDEIVALHDERFYRMWTFYLAGATAAFESGGMCNFQVQYTRDRRALPLSRDYIASAEQHYLSEPGNG